VSAARVTCVLACAAGLALAARTNAIPAAPPERAFGYTVLAADLHVHGSPDGIPPWDAVQEARRRRLDVVALTSHNSMIGWWLWRHAPHREPGVMVLPGEELTSVGYHMAIVGLRQTITWHRSAASAAAAAHAQDAVAILAHPSGSLFRRVVTDDVLRAVDGIEVAHPSKEPSNHARQDFADVYGRASTLRRVAAIGSSDFHYFGPIGVCRTYLFVREATPDGVLEAIRAGRTVACDARGRTTGAGVLADAVARRCAADATLPPAGDTFAARAGTTLAWCALAALVVLGASRT
jgi:PHP-associated